MNKYFGYIEGYYGRILTWEQRHALLDHLRALSMNTYFYAPKEDPYHRLLWKKKYPHAWQNKFKQFASAGKRKKITVIPALAPGLSFDYLSGKDYSLLLDKFRMYIQSGIDTLALLMDDIPEDLPDSCKTDFSSLGEAHGLLLKKLLYDLKKENNKIKLWFCPTIYTDQFVKGRAVDCRYIKDLAAAMPASVTLMWTGPQVVSEKLNRKNIGGITKMFRGNIVIWDNYYANDYAPLRLFVGPFTGRGSSIPQSTRGILINPTGLFHTDKFLLSLFADFLNNRRATIAGWEKTADDYNIPGNFYPIRKYFWSPFIKPFAKDFTERAIKKYGNLHDDLLVGWQNPLKQEWYPFLYGFWQDISCLTMAKKKQKPWQDIYYPPVIALRMDKS